MSSGHRVKTEGGKYEFSILRDGDINILRHGEAWARVATGQHAVRALMMELDAARVVIAAAQRALDLQHKGVAPIEGLQKALQQHDRLVGDDRMPPSAWCQIR